MPRNRRFHWILPAKAALPPLETTAKGTQSPLDSPANRVLSSLLETQSQRNCYPFGIPARFEMSTHKWKMVCRRSFQNDKIPRTSSRWAMKFCGFFMYTDSHIALFFANSQALRHISSTECVAVQPRIVSAFCTSAQNAARSP